MFILFILFKLACHLDESIQKVMGKKEFRIVNYVLINLEGAYGRPTFSQTANRLSGIFADLLLKARYKGQQQHQ